jgi:hypothetical protein
MRLELDRSESIGLELDPSALHGVETYLPNYILVGVR